MLVSRRCHGECYRAGNLSVTGVSEAACHELAREAGAGRSGAAGCESPGPAQPSRTIDSWELALESGGPGPVTSQRGNQAVGSTSVGGRHSHRRENGGSHLTQRAVNNNHQGHRVQFAQLRIC